VRGFYQSRGQFQVWSTTARADGPLFRLPAGDAKLAVGFEYRTERNLFAVLDDEFTPDPVPQPTPGLPASRRVSAAYAELLLPLFGGAATAPGLRRLDLSLAARVEDYRDLGTTTNPRVGVTWEPLAGMRMRGTYGTSFRAPGFQEIRQGPGTSAIFAQPLPDPMATDGMTNALVRVGNSPDIGPEKARTWTAGVEFQPAFAPGLHIEATYFDVRYRDRIATIAADYFNFLANRNVYSAVIDETPSAAAIEALYAAPGFSNPFGIVPADIGVIVDARTQNLSLVRQNGVDFAARFTTDWLGGEARLGLAGSYLFKIRQKLTRQAPSIDVVDQVGNPVALRLRGEAGFSRDGFELSSFVNHVGGYTNQTVTPARPVASWTTLDVQLAYRFPDTVKGLGGTRIAVSVSNLFDRPPPFVENFTGLSASGFDPEKASPIGRMISLQLVRRW
jgi:outer membrane receptor protein involved in Fe transport